MIEGGGAPREEGVMCQIEGGSDVIIADGVMAANMFASGRVDHIKRDGHGAFSQVLRCGWLVAGRVSLDEASKP